MSLLIRARPALASAVDEAQASPLIAAPPTERRWLRLIGFLALSPLLMAVGLFVLIAVMPLFIPGGWDALDMSVPLPETPDRLWGENAHTLSLGAMLGLMAAGITLAAMLVYRQPWRAFAWPGRRFDVSHFLVGLAMMAAVFAILAPISYAMGDPWSPPLFNALYPTPSKLAYVAASVVGLLVAAAAEEVVFRGVLLRISAAFTRNVWLLCAVNALAFSAIHLDPDPVAFVAIAMSGFVWVWAALRLGGLEFAIGAHLGNNLMISLFVEPISEFVPTDDRAQWIELAPEFAVCVITVIFIERLAHRAKPVDAPQTVPV